MIFMVSNLNLYRFGVGSGLHIVAQFWYSSNRAKINGSNRFELVRTGSKPLKLSTFLMFQRSGNVYLLI